MTTPEITDPLAARLGSGWAFLINGLSFGAPLGLGFGFPFSRSREPGGFSFGAGAFVTSVSPAAVLVSGGCGTLGVGVSSISTESSGKNGFGVIL